MNMDKSDIPALKPTPTVTPRNGLVIVKILNLLEFSDDDSNNDNNSKKDQEGEVKRKDLNVEIIVEDYHEVSVVRNEENENENNENEHENVDRKQKKKKLFLDCKVVNSNNEEESDIIMRSSQTQTGEVEVEVEVEALYESYFLLSENDPNILRFNMSLSTCSSCEIKKEKKESSSSTTTTIGSSSASSSYLVKIPSREYKSSYSDWFHIKTATLNNNNNNNNVSGVKVLLDISYIPPLSSTKRSNKNAMLTLTSSSSTLMDILTFLRKFLFIFFISIFIFESIQKKSKEGGEIKPQDAASIISSSSLSSVSDMTPPPTTTTLSQQVVQQISDHDIQATNDINTDEFVPELDENILPKKTATVIMNHEGDDTTDIKKEEKEKTKDNTSVTLTINNADIALLQYKDTLNDLLLKINNNNDIINNNKNNKKQDLIKMKDSFQQTISLLELELELELNRNSNDTDDESENLVSLFSVKLNYFSTILHLYAIENLVLKQEGGLLEGGVVVVVVKDDGRTTIIDELQTSFHKLLSDYDCSSLYNNSISLNDSSEATTTTSSSFMKEKKRLCEITQNNLDFAIELNDVSSSSSPHEEKEEEKEESIILIEHHDDQEKELISTDISVEEGEIMENKPTTTVYEQYNQILQKISSNDDEDNEDNKNKNNVLHQEQILHEMKKTLEQIIINNNTEVDLFSLHLNYASVLLHLEALKYYNDHYDDTTNDSSSPSSTTTRKAVLQNVIDSFQQLLMKENCYYHSDNDDTPPPPTTTRLCEITRNNLDFAYELSTQHQHSRHHQSSTADMDNLLLPLVSKYNEFVQDLLQMTFSDEESTSSYNVQTKASILKSIIDSFSLSSSSSLLSKEKEEVSSFQFSVELNYASILLHLQTLKVNATVLSTSNDNNELELKSIINSFHQLFSDHCVVGVTSEESKRLCGITNNNLDFAQELLTAGAAKR